MSPARLRTELRPAGEPEDPQAESHRGETVPLQVPPRVPEIFQQLQRQSKTRADSQGPGKS